MTALLLRSKVARREPMRRQVATRRRWLARSIASLILSVAMVVPARASAARPCWQPPVEAPVRDPYRAPACPYCAGNRGIEYATGTGATVRAVAAGRVTYAGAVAGTKYVVVQLASGWKVTYGNVVSERRVNDVVVAGSVIGQTDGALHFGLRDGNRYVDPTPLLGVPRYRARLVPTDGSPGNQPGRLSMRCGAVPEAIP